MKILGLIFKGLKQVTFVCLLILWYCHFDDERYGMMIFDLLFSGGTYFLLETFERNTRNTFGDY